MQYQQYTNVILFGVQEIIQNISTSIHDDPASIIPPFELLLDEEINDNFLRDVIESIAHCYNS